MSTNQKKHKLSIRQVYLGTAVILLTLLTVIYQSYNSLNDARETSEWVNHTREVIAEVQAIERNITSLGAIQRGFILTSQDRYLEMYEKDLPRSFDQIDEVQRLTLDNKTQQAQCEELKSLLKALDNIYQINLALVKKNRNAEAIERVKRGDGQEKVDQILDLVKNMTMQEENLLIQRLKDQKDAIAQTKFVMLSTTVITFLMIVFLSLLVITEFRRRTRTQIELDKSNQFQKAILNSAPFAIITGNNAGNITLFNPAAEKLLGYNSQEILGKAPSQFHDQKEIEAMSEKLSKRFGEKIEPGYETFIYRAKKNIIESDPWTYLKKDGSKIPVNLSIAPQWDENGKISGFVGIAHDISKQLEYEHALIGAKEQALAGTKAKSEFLANMSHEIRTPMNAIMGMAELLEETNLDDEQRRYVETFQRAGESLLNLINDILDLSKIEAGHFELDYVPFNISDVVDKASEIVAIKAHQKNLELAVDIDEKIHENYIGDPNRIRQIILNLLGNSIKFTKEGEIVLKISQAPEKDKLKGIVIDVKDTGIGMTSDQLNILFERFRQADSSITKEYGGTGLGLNITKRLVELMGGKIEVKSTLNTGTEFKVTIYAKIDEHPIETAKVSLIGKRILVVDDNKTNLYIFRKILSHHDAEIDDAENGQKALDLIHEKALNKTPYDLILLDGKMPGIDGFMVAEKVQSSKDLQGPILMMITSDNRPGDLARARALGLKSYLLKPILREELLKQIQKALFQNYEEKKRPEIIIKQVIESKLNILLVDDNDENRLVIRSFVKNLPWKLDEAKNGQEALDMHAKRHYDLILMDMQMPVMDGYTATREMRKIERQRLKDPTPILALTAYALKEEVDKSLESGCNGHISKPISKNNLIKSIESHSAEIKVQVDKDLEDLIPAYLNNRKIEIEEIQTAFDQEDFAKIQAIGHKLRGTAGSYGFDGLSDIGKVLEERAKVSDKTSINHTLNQYRLYLKRVRIDFH